MCLVVRPRSPALAPFVRSISYFAGDESPARLERSLPSGGTSLMVNLHEDEFRTYEGPDHTTVRRVRGAMLVGPRAGPMVIDTAEQRHILNVSFAVVGASPFFPILLSDARDQMVELGALWGRDGEVLREQLCEAVTPEEIVRVVETVLLDHAVGPLERDPAVAFAIAAFERGVLVSEVTARLGLLPKPFARRFRQQVGLTPKRLSRVRRLQRLLGEVHRNGPVYWAQVALKHGYFDQSHLINDFRALTGLTPAAYVATVGDERNHVPLTVSGG